MLRADYYNLYILYLFNTSVYLRHGGVPVAESPSVNINRCPPSQFFVSFLFLGASATTLQTSPKRKTKGMDVDLQTNSQCRVV